MPGLLSGLAAMLQSRLEKRARSLSIGLSARRGASSRKLWRAAARNFVKMPSVKGGTVTRQRRRAALRVTAFADITRQYSGEPRAARRRMARGIAKREWRSVTI